MPTILNNDGAQTNDLDIIDVSQDQQKYVNFRQIHEEENDYKFTVSK